MGHALPGISLLIPRLNRNAALYHPSSTPYAAPCQPVVSLNDSRCVWRPFRSGFQSGIAGDDAENAGHGISRKIGTLYRGRCPWLGRPVTGKRRSLSACGPAPSALRPAGRNWHSTRRSSPVARRITAPGSDACCDMRSSFKPCLSQTHVPADGDGSSTRPSSAPGAHRHKGRCARRGRRRRQWKGPGRPATSD
jgi:hypothetical protein